jgi:nucleotide-binding universal stress UspA family protein
MLNTVLIPLDGTPESADVLPVASALAGAVGARVRLLRVVPAAGPHHHPGIPNATQEATDYLDRVSAALRKDAGLATQSVVRQGEPAAQIVQEILAAGVDLVAMTTHGRSGLQRAMLGSVAERTLEHSPVPVLVQRPGGRRVTEIGTLLVPVDGSPGGALALGSAVALAHATHARVVLLQVVVPLAFVIARSGVGATMGPVYYDPAWDEELLTSAQGYVSGLAARLQRNGINAEGRVVEGQDVLMTITETTDQVDPDLIVMSTHALTGAARAVLGSVSDGVVRTTGHPVLLVRQETAARLLEPEATHNADNPD